MTVQQLVDANVLDDNGQNLIIGQVLLIPPPLATDLLREAEQATPQEEFALEAERLVQDEAILNGGSRKACRTITCGIPSSDRRACRSWCVPGRVR